MEVKATDFNQSRFIATIDKSKVGVYYWNRTCRLETTKGP